MKRSLYFVLFLFLLIVLWYLIFTGHQISEVNAVGG